MAERKEFVYYKKNVAYFVGVRMNPRDPIGRLLTEETPDVAVDVDELREFKLANKRAIIEGLIIPTTEPNLDWETPNSLDDEEINELLKSYLKLKAKLQTINSLSVVFKIKNLAKEQNKSPKILAMIEERETELEPSVDDPAMQRGVEQG